MGIEWQENLISLVLLGKEEWEEKSEGNKKMENKTWGQKHEGGNQHTELLLMIWKEALERKGITHKIDHNSGIL